MSTFREEDRTRSREWLLVAVSSLGLAGVLATALVFARMPVLSKLVTDPGFFKRCLVVHVDLALVVWFYAFVAALFALIPSRVPANPIARRASLFAVSGVALLLAAAGAPGARAILANYVPVIDHPLYVAGLVAIAFGLACTFLDPKLLPGTEEKSSFLPPAAIVGLRASAIAVLFALLTFFSTRLSLTKGLSPETHWELLMWGGGHVLQFASVAAMLAVWSILLSRSLKGSVLSRRAAVAVFALLLAPVFAAPILPFADVSTYHITFTRMMQFGIAPAVLLDLSFCVRAMVRARVTLRDPAVLGFAASAVLTLVGFALGASIRGPNTTIPAHYHASIGAVTVSFMAVTLPLLEALGFASPSRRLRTWAAVQPLMLGGGQLVFAIGFALAGAHGMQRKTYGGEQIIRTTGETIGLAVMGIGGAVAVAGGILFLFIVGAMWRRRVVQLRTERGLAWR